MFAGMKKKSKKKQVALDLGDSVPAEEHAEAPTSAAKETTTTTTESESVVPPPAVIETKAEAESGSGVATPVDGEAVAEDGGDPFADLKKKKKKKKDIPLDLVSMIRASRSEGSC